MNSHHSDLTSLFFFFFFFLDFNYLILIILPLKILDTSIFNVPIETRFPWHSSYLDHRSHSISSIKMIARWSSCIAGARVRARNTWDRSYSRGAADSTTNIVAGVAETRYERCCFALVPINRIAARISAAELLTRRILMPIPIIAIYQLTERNSHLDLSLGFHVSGISSCWSALSQWFFRDFFILWIEIVKRKYILGLWDSWIDLLKWREDRKSKNCEFGIRSTVLWFNIWKLYLLFLFNTYYNVLFFTQIKSRKIFQILIEEIMPRYFYSLKNLIYFQYFNIIFLTNYTLLFKFHVFFITLP